MSARRPRLLPGVLLASGLVMAAAAGVLASTDPPGHASARTCDAGQVWVTVRPADVPVDGWRLAPPSPTLAGCVDRSTLSPAPPVSDERG